MFSVVQSMNKVEAGEESFKRAYLLFISDTWPASSNTFLRKPFPGSFAQHWWYGTFGGCACVELKCKVWKQSLHEPFSGLTKTFDCRLSSFMTIHQQLCSSSGHESEHLTAQTGVKQRWIIAPTLLITFITAIITYQHPTQLSVQIPYRTDGRFFNLYRFKSKAEGLHQLHIVALLWCCCRQIIMPSAIIQNKICTHCAPPKACKILRLAINSK